MDIQSTYQIIQFEREHKWRFACKYLLGLWENERDNADLLLQTIAEHWLTLVDYKDQYIDLKKTLVLLTRYGLKHFNREAKFLSLVGYMITLFPYLFFENSAEEQDGRWQKTGESMLLKAYRLEPRNILFKVLYLGSKSYTKEYMDAKKQLKTQLYTFFPGETAIEIYFRDVLS